jgi:hypothetical protein
MQGKEGWISVFELTWSIRIRILKVCSAQPTTYSPMLRSLHFCNGSRDSKPWGVRGLAVG